MSGFFPDKYQRSHISCITWYYTLICHCFLVAQHSCHGSEKGSEYCQWHGVSQDSHTWGTSLPDLDALQANNVFHSTFYSAVFLRVDTQSNIKGTAFCSQCLVILCNASVLRTVFGQKRESSISEVKPKGRL